jgi:hypothetical protein
LPVPERENKIIGAVLDKIGEEHPNVIGSRRRGRPGGITLFIRRRSLPPKRGLTE